MKDVLDKYEALAGILPSRVVVHKTSGYEPEEDVGFRRAAKSRVPVCDLIWMRSTAFRLIRKGTQEPWRGTLCTIGDKSYLFTSGYVPWWDEYPGRIFLRRFRSDPAARPISANAPERFWH